MAVKNNFSNSKCTKDRLSRRYMYKCTMAKQKRQWLSHEGSTGIVISSEFLTVLRTVTGVIMWTVHCLGNETNNFIMDTLIYTIKHAEIQLQKLYKYIPAV